ARLVEYDDLPILLLPDDRRQGTGEHIAQPARRIAVPNLYRLFREALWALGRSRCSCMTEDGEGTKSRPSEDNTTSHGLILHYQYPASRSRLALPIDSFRACGFPLSAGSGSLRWRYHW